MVTHCSIFGGRGGGAASSSTKNCRGGIGGGETSPLSNSSSTENSCGGIGGGGGEFWAVLSTERVPGGIIIDLSEHTQVY